MRFAKVTLVALMATRFSCPSVLVSSIQSKLPSSVLSSKIPFIKRGGLLLVIFFLCSQARADVSGTAIVVDGDTLSIAGIKVRLNGIDTPEKDQTCKANGLTYSCGYDATEAVRKWTYTKEVRCVGDQTDRYGRLIADCYVSGYNLNARIVYEGLGLAYRKYSKKYVSEEDQAREARRGIWAGEFVAPWDWRKGKRLAEEEAPVACCKICKKGKACGNSCINKSYNCSKPKGCACDG